MPGVVDRLATPVTARMLSDDAPVLANDDPISIGLDLDRPADRAGADRVFVVVEPHQAGLRHRGLQGMEAVEAAAIRNEVGPFLFEDLPDRSIGPLGMGMRL